jgi:GNAT superfamily N-acetyltransferase
VAAHSQHDLVAAEVRSWYTDWADHAAVVDETSTSVGVASVRKPFGFLRTGPGSVRRLMLTTDVPADVAGALASATQFFETTEFEVWCDDRARAFAIELALLSLGFVPAESTSVLALVGGLRAADGPAALEVEEVSDEQALRSWARVKLQGFAGSEDEPSSDVLAAEMSARRAEWPISRYDLALLDDEAVAALAHYTASSDQMVFLLATRVPFRHRGIAQSMLRRWVDRATSAGARSVLINCAEGGQPAALYRRMGFTDEVYWHRRYDRAVTPS